MHTSNCVPAIQTRSTTESAAAYALCYKCHDRNRVRNNPGFATTASKSRYRLVFCAMTLRRRRHVALVNFDKRFVSPRNGVLTWTRGNNGLHADVHGATHRDERHVSATRVRAGKAAREIPF